MTHGMVICMHVLTQVPLSLMQDASAVVRDVVCHSVSFRCVILHSVTFKSGSIPEEVEMQQRYFCIT